MTKNKTKGGTLRFPKTILGVKVPKKTRKNLNALLKRVPASDANPLVAAAVGALLPIIVERLERPLEDFVNAGKRVKEANATKEEPLPSTTPH